jgi:VCBS repeat-containing protein
VGRAVLAPGTRLTALTRGGAKVAVPCAKACRATVALKVDAATARRLGLGRKAAVLATGRATTTKAGSVTVTLKARGRAAKALRRAKRLAATLAVTVDGGAPQTIKVSLKQ